MVIRDEHIRFLVLSHLIENALHSKEVLRECEADPCDLDTLAGLSSGDLARLAALPEPRISVWMDGKQLPHGFRLLSHVKNHAQLLNYFVQHGATTAMLAGLFRLSMADITARRAAMGITPERKKPVLPPVAAREAVQHAWYNIRKKRADSKPSSADYFELHQQFPGYSLAALNAAVNEFA